MNRSVHRSPRGCRRAFALPAACAAVIVAAALIAFVAVVVGVGSRGGIDSYSFGHAAGALVVVLLVAGVIGGLVLRFTHEKSPWIGTSVTAFVLVAHGLFSAASIGGRSLHWSSPSVWREVDRINSRMVQEVRQSVEADAATADLEAIMARYTPEFDKLRSRMKGDDLIAFDVGMGYARDVTTITSNYLASLRPFLKAGGIDPKTLTSKESIIKRREMIKYALSNHRTAVAAFEKTPQDLASRATKLGMSDSDAAKMTETLLAGMRFQKMLRIQRLEDDIATVMDEHLADLQKRWSNWKVKDGQVLFSDILQKSLDAFNARLQRLDALIAEQKSLQAEAIDRRTNR